MQWKSAINICVKKCDKIIVLKNAMKKCAKNICVKKYNNDRVKMQKTC